MSRILTLFLFVILTTTAAAQVFNLSGKCVDKKGAPIFNVKVISKTAITPIVYTDDNGIYDLQFSDPDTVVVEYSIFNDVTQIQSFILTEKYTRAKPVRFNFQQENEVKVHV